MLTVLVDCRLMVLVTYYDKTMMVEEVYAV